MLTNHLKIAIRNLPRRKERLMKLKVSHRNLFLAVVSLIISVEAHAQTNMTAEKWQEDLRYLQEVVNTERSNLFHKITSAEFKQEVNTLHAKIPQMQRHEIIVRLARLVAMFRIGHTVLPLHVWQHDPDPNSAFHRFPETIFIGEPTSENVNFYGDVVRKALPNSGLHVFLSHLWWQNLDPRDTREWTAPPIAVDMTFDDHRNNRDQVMEAILHYTPQPALTEKLKALFINGKTPEARKQALSHRADPRNRFDNVEDKLNRLGYELINEKNMDAALDAFRLNVELYPNSANCYDSLAECYWKRGDLPAAIQHYEKAIALDPNGPVGANSAQMLKEVRAQAQSANK